MARLERKNTSMSSTNRDPGYYDLTDVQKAFYDGYDEGYKAAPPQEELIFARCMDSRCIDRRLHYTQDCPPRDIDDYQYRKLQERQS